MAKNKTQTQTKITIGILGLIGAYVWQKKFAFIKTATTIGLYPSEEYWNVDAQEVDYKPGDKLGRVVKKLKTADFGDYYVVKTKEGMFAFVPVDSVPSDVKLGWI